MEDPSERPGGLVWEEGGVGEKLEVTGGWGGTPALTPWLPTGGPLPLPGRHSHVIGLYVVLFHALQHQGLQTWKRPSPREEQT